VRSLYEFRIYLLLNLVQDVYNINLSGDFNSRSFNSITLHSLNEGKVTIGGLVVAFLPLGPRIPGSNPTEDDAFIRAVEIRTTTSFGRELNLSVSCRKICCMLKNLTSVTDTS
jgi:hypothetical protein